MKYARFYALLKSNEMIGKSKFYFYNLGALNNSESSWHYLLIIQLNNHCSLAENMPVSIFFFFVFILFFDS